MPSRKRPPVVVLIIPLFIGLLGVRTDRRTLQYWRAPSWEEIAKAK